MIDPQWRLTERARFAVKRAEERATEEGFSEYTAEHIMLGLLDDPGSVAETALSNLGLDPRSFAGLLEARVANADSPADHQELELSENAERAVQLAHAEGKSLGVNFVGAEHLFLGVVGESPIVSKLLRAQGIDLLRIRKEILRLMGMGGADLSDSDLIKTRPTKPSPMLNEEIQDLYDRIEELNERIEEATMQSDLDLCMSLKGTRDRLKLECEEKEKDWSKKISIIGNHKGNPEVRTLVTQLAELKKLEAAETEEDIKTLRKKEWELMDRLLKVCEGLSKED